MRRISLIFLFILLYVVSAQPALAALVNAGGYGGNKQIGQIVYSVIPNKLYSMLPPINLPALTVTRDENNGTCYLENDNARIINHDTGQITQFACKEPDPSHNNLFWDANLGEENDGYSPENDALYAADVITKMFDDWYSIPFYQEERTKLPIVFKLHEDIPDDPYNVFIYRNEIHIGSGNANYYPYTSLNILSYQLGFMFTEQYADLDWMYPQSTSIAGAFSCMTAMAVEYYLTGKNTWQVGANITKNGEAIHYLDDPTKNCHGGTPGEDCDIVSAFQYDESNRKARYYGVGLYNRVFYLLATSKNWNTHKAYDVFVHANQYYWKSNSNFIEAACGILVAAQELHYDIQAIKQAFSSINLNISYCDKSYFAKVKRSHRTLWR